MHAFVLTAVLVYAPDAGHAAGQRPQVTAALERAMRAAGAEVIADPVSRAQQRLAQDAALAADAAQSLARAEAHFEEGKHALERVELERAESAFAAAERIYRAQLLSPMTAARFGATSLQRGVALLELGRTSEARRAFRRAVSLDPSSTLTEATVRPDAARAFAAAIASRRNQHLTVLASPAASVMLDGASIGHTPVAVDSPEGEHVLLLRAPDHLPMATLVELDDAPLEVEYTLADDPSGHAVAPLRARPSRDGLTVLAETLALDSVVIVGLAVDAGNLTLVGQRIDRHGIAGAPKTMVVVQSIDQAASALLTRLQGDGVLPSATGQEIVVLEAQPIAHPRAPTDSAIPRGRRRPRLFERPLFWGGVLTAVSAAIVIGGLASAGPSTTYQAHVAASQFGGH